MSAFDDHCELCRSTGGEPVWQDDLCRVVRVDDRDYPAYCRVIWGAHVKEMSDLNGADRRHFMNVTFAVEAALRRLAVADKMNLASFGNQVPHLHWHVIARHSDDRHFPHPIWATPVRESSAPRRPIETTALKSAIVEALAEEHGGGL